MSTMTKVFIVLASVFAIIVSCLSIAGAAQWTKAKEVITWNQQLAAAAIVQRQSQEAIMVTTLAMKNDMIRAENERIAKLQDRELQLTTDLANRSNDLAQARNLQTAAEAGRKKLEEMLDVVTSQLTNLQKQNGTLLTSNIDLQTRNQRLASRVLEVTSENTILTDETRNLQEKLYASEQKVKELQQTLASGKRVAPEAAAVAGVQAIMPAAVPPIKGEIVGVDGAYVNLNVGETSGVVAGMTFMVYRDATYVGDIKVVTVREKESGGKITMLNSGQEVQRGDRVAYGD